LTALKIALLTVGATLFYAYVGHMVPQKITYPPESIELSADMTTEEMVVAGEKIVGGKGTCLSCHTIGSHSDGARFPDLGGIGASAASRKDGLDDVDYLAESLYEPNAYIVEGFNPGMLPAGKPPISLSDQEILSVIAYLQSLGGTPSVTMQTTTKYSSDPSQLEAAAPPPRRGPPRSLSGEQLVENYGCVTCHAFDSPAQMLGPSLHDVGARLSTIELYESILDPDATVTQGFPPGLMMTTLNATQFYQNVTAKELKTMVDYLDTLGESE
jgi:cytochrome c2